MTVRKKFTQWVSRSSQATDMTTGKILPILISFAMPIMIGNLFQQIYSMVDAAVVGITVAISLGLTVLVLLFGR